ncbi:MAG: ParB/RepB/Spo0J family partition protein [Rubrimonas sp.]|uniref:ParB/RepB/Spo0J family partition protein n=1 Tax=Rubrimonas sp. TaxID=2036015 RepID=UPI002FDE70E2
MSETQRRKGLGRGLAALMDDVRADPDPGSAAPAATAPIERIRPNPNQPRKRFDEEDLDSLAASIRARGVVQPLIVRPDPADPSCFQIVAGERRWRAAQRAQLHELPVIVREMTDSDVLEVAIVENIQRADLNPIEEAAGFAQLVERFGHTQEQLGEALGKSRSYIANALRLLTLPDEVIAMTRDGRLSAGHARALITAPDPVALARVVVARGLSVRETERLAKTAAAPRPARAEATGRQDADTRALEADLTAATGLRVAIRHGGSGGGEVRIAYRDLDQLDGICQLLSR